MASRACPTVLLSAPSVILADQKVNTATASLDGANQVRRCPHGNYWPEDLEVNTYCSGCRPATHMVKLKDKSEQESDEKKFTSCPICSSKEFRYESEDSYSCPNCGFGVGDII